MAGPLSTFIQSADVDELRKERDKLRKELQTLKAMVSAIDHVIASKKDAA